LKIYVWHGINNLTDQLKPLLQLILIKIGGIFGSLNMTAPPWLTLSGVSLLSLFEVVDSNLDVAAVYLFLYLAGKGLNELLMSLFFKLLELFGLKNLCLIHCNEIDAVALKLLSIVTMGNQE